MRMNARGVILAGPGKAWLDDDTLITQVGSDAAGWRTEDQHGNLIDKEGFNSLAAGGGKWATWLAGRGPKGNFGPLDHAGYVMDIGRDGTVAWCPNQQAGTPVVVDGVTYPIVARGVRVVGPGHIVASLFNGHIWSNRLGYARLPVGVTPFNLTMVDDWLLYHTHEHLIIQKFSAPIGKRIAEKPAYSPDMVRLESGELKVSWCLNEAETVTVSSVLKDATLTEDLSGLQDVPSLPLPIPPTPVPTPTPKPPVPPKPVPTPVPPRPWLPMAVRFSGGPVKVFAKLNGKYIGVDPTATKPTIYHDRTAGGAWEEIDLQPAGDGTFSARFIAADKQLSITSEGLQLRPAGTAGEWERFRAATQPGDDLSLLYRAEGGTLVQILTIEEAA